MKAFVDTNIFIYALEMHPEFGEESGKILEKIDEGEIDGNTSSLVILEICWYLESRNRLNEMKTALDLITGSKIKVIDTVLQDIRYAVSDKTSYTSIDLNDLINYNLMKRSKLNSIYTNDSHFDKLPGVQSVFNKKPLEQ